MSRLDKGPPPRPQGNHSWKPVIPGRIHKRPSADDPLATPGHPPCESSDPSSTDSSTADDEEEDDEDGWESGTCSLSKRHSLLHSGLRKWISKHKGIFKFKSICWSLSIPILFLGREVNCYAPNSFFSPNCLNEIADLLDCTFLFVVFCLSFLDLMSFDQLALRLTLWGVGRMSKNGLSRARLVGLVGW